MVARNWLTNELKQKIREVFEPRYKRKLTSNEIEEIANNLTGYMETILKYKHKKKKRESLPEK